MGPDDADLLRAFVERGDRAALGALVERHQREVHDLVRRILRDDNVAEDVTQETFVRLLESAATYRGEAPVRVWLFQMAVNAARNRIRSRVRRQRHEEAATSAQSRVPEPADAEAMRAEVRAAVADLPEDYQVPIVLHFFRGLTHAEVGQVLGCPAGTVSARIHHGKERLRERLGTGAAGLVPGWEGLLPGLEEAAPLPAGLTARLAEIVTTAAVPAAGLPTAAGLGHGGHGTLAALGTGLLLVGLGGAATIALVNRGAPDSGGSAESRPAGPPAERRVGFTLAGGPLETRGSGMGPPTAQPSPSPAPEASGSEPRSPGAAGVLRGVVLGPDGRTPIPRVAVAAHPAIGTLPEGMRLPHGLTLSRNAAAPRRTETDESGRFEFADLPIGLYELVAEGAGTGEARAAGAPRAGPPALVPPLLLVLGRDAEARRLEVRVVRADGSPAAGSRVSLATAHGDPPSLEVADEEGLTRFWDVLPERVLVTAQAARDGFATARDVVDTGSATRDGEGDRPRRLVLASAATIEGRVTAPGSADLSGTTVRASPLLPGDRDWDVPGARAESPVDSAGRFRIEGLPAGRYRLHVRAVGGLALAGDAATVDLVPGERATADLRLMPGATLRGSVTSAETGEVLPGARVEVVAVVAPGAGDSPIRRRLAWTDERGLYEVPGLAPGVSYRVRVLPWVHAVEVVPRVGMAAGETRELVHRLPAAGVLDATVPAGSLLGVRPVGSDEVALTVRAPVRSAGCAVAAVTVPGLAAGEWELLALDGGGWPPAVLARFAIRAFETTFVDAGDSPRGR